MKQYAHTVINFRTFIFEFVDPFTDDVTDRKNRKKSFRIRKKTAGNLCHIAYHVSLA